MTTSKRQPVLGTEDHAGRLAASNILRLFSHDPLHKYNTEEVGYPSGVLTTLLTLLSPLKVYYSQSVVFINHSTTNSGK